MITLFHSYWELYFLYAIIVFFIVCDWIEFEEIIASIIIAFIWPVYVVIWLIKLLRFILRDLI